MLCIRYHFDDLREWDGQIGIEYKRATGSNSNSNRTANDNYTRYYIFSSSSIKIVMWCVEYSVLVLQRVVYSYSMNCNRRQRDNNNHNNNNNNSNKRATDHIAIHTVLYILFIIRFFRVFIEIQVAWITEISHFSVQFQLCRVIKWVRMCSWILHAANSICYNFFFSSILHSLVSPLLILMACDLSNSTLGLRACMIIWINFISIIIQVAFCAETNNI